MIDPQPRPAFRFALLLVVGLTTACSQDEIVPEPYRPSGAWDTYRHGLEVAGLGRTALGRDWIDAAEEATATPARVELPYQEVGRFDARQAYAAGYRFAALRGQSVRVAVEVESDEPPRVYLDLFRLEDGSEPVHVASAPAGESRLAFEPRRDADYLLRLQPELLRGGTFRLEAVAAAVLEFPVEGKDVTAIQSRFGAPRDAGRRRHHGVDIFAPRGTAVLAASHAVVRRIDERGLGGKVVWLYDRQRSLNLYYAHLDSQEVEEGVEVAPGDLIGRVGNTGNARTTPPHLHFGVYARGSGPIDPWNFLRQPGSTAPAVRANTDLLGRWAVTSVEGASLREHPSSRSTTLESLVAGTPLRIWAAADRYYRVLLEDGTVGFLRDAQVGEPAAAATPALE